MNGLETKQMQFQKFTYLIKEQVVDGSNDNIKGYTDLHEALSFMKRC